MAKRKSSGGTFVEREMFESKAFHALKGFAPQLLILFLGKRQFERQMVKGNNKKKNNLICINCDSIYFTYIEAEKKYGITKTRFSHAIADLLAKGFISIRHHGGGYQKDKTIYALIDKWIIWRPGVVFEKRDKNSVQRGFCKIKTKVTHEIVPIHSHENAPKERVLV